MSMSIMYIILINSKYCVERMGLHHPNYCCKYIQCNVQFLITKDQKFSKQVKSTWLHMGAISVQLTLHLQILRFKDTEGPT